MSRNGSTAVERHLGWLIFQAFFLVPFALGQMSVEEWAYESLPLRLLDLALALVIGFFVVRNLRRLWLAPAPEASRLTSALQLVVGGILLLISTGPLLESHRYSTKPMGVSLMLVGGILALLGLRDIARIRARQRVTTGA